MIEEPKVGLGSEIKARGMEIVVQARSIKVENQESATYWSAKLSVLKDAVKGWKEIWKPHKDRISAALKGVRDDENSFLSVAEPVMAEINSKLGIWTLRERERVQKEKEAREKAEWEAAQAKREAEKKVEEASDEGGAINFEDVPLPAAVALPPLPVKPTLDGLQPRDHWVPVIEDLDLFMEKAPRRFLKMDEAAVQEHVTKHRGDTDIPGIKAVNRPIMAKVRRTA